ncbi:MAG: plastocyanin/azurin family copper-binding protein [Gemmatimonadetes bacterium]|nr:plastocyanin/azurin family copper-binding protein [Gemmatimonadota bacterium]
MRTSHRTAIFGIALVLVAAACGGGESKPADASAGGAAQSAVAATGTVIEISATTDDKGSYYEPKEITAKPGDVLRVKLITGVHNVNFLPDSNPGKAGLPAASAFLQLPGQTIDIPLTFGEGDFYFQCDPHAALGMKGRVVVKK